MSLPALPRVDRILLGILLLGALLVALLHWLLAPPEKTGGIQPLPSTFFNVGSGAKAAYDVLDQLKYRVTRLRRRISAESLAGSRRPVHLAARRGAGPRRSRRPGGLGRPGARPGPGARRST